MPRRRMRPSDATDAVVRLATVLPATGARGWVPDVPDLGSEAAPPTLPAAEPDLPAGAPPALRTSVSAPASAAPPLPVVRRNVRFEPGRRGVLALALVASLAAATAGVFVLRGRPVEVAAPTVDRAGVPIGRPATPPAAVVVVSVGGKVRRPGLVRLPSGSRVDDAVRAAGGATAPIGLLNLARRLVDGEQVLVGVAGAESAGGHAAGLIGLNSATAAQLDALPGIGPVLAERIVAWRTEHGPFASVDQLREVPGIGESKYLQLKTKVSV